jgi:hypothetical protein
VVGVPVFVAEFVVNVLSHFSTTRKSASVCVSWSAQYPKITVVLYYL